MRVIRLVFFMRSIIASAVPSAGVGKPNDLRQDHREGSFEARRSGEVQTFWSLPPDCAVVSAGRQAIANTSREVQMSAGNSDMSHETISGDAWESTDW